MIIIYMVGDGQSEQKIANLVVHHQIERDIIIIRVLQLVLPLSYLFDQQVNIILKMENHMVHVLLYYQINKMRAKVSLI